ncbi:hypothetical protein VPHD480_0185 [Vibrio phage D480]|nr:hypothetical protein MYOV011v1_p0029 [Vibrio phage 6E35.1a]
MNIMNAQDLRIVEELIEQKDATVVEKSDYRAAMAFAYGSMSAPQREIFKTYHSPYLAERYDIEYCTDTQVILPTGHLKTAIAFVKDVLPTQEIDILKRDFQFDLGIL